MIIGAVISSGVYGSFQWLIYLYAKFQDRAVVYFTFEFGVHSSNTTQFVLILLRTNFHYFEPFDHRDTSISIVKKTQDI